jgi:hypothetical protein
MGLAEIELDSQQLVFLEQDWTLWTAEEAESVFP